LRPYRSAKDVGSEKGRYGYKRTVALAYEQAVERITATLKEQGFGILTRST